MSDKPRKILSACWNSVRSGTVHLANDWLEDRPPPLVLEPGHSQLENVRKLSPIHFARRSGYFRDDGWLTLVFTPEGSRAMAEANVKVFVAGNFNGWSEAVGKQVWRLARREIEGRIYFTLRVSLEKMKDVDPMLFKFINGSKEWMPLPEDAPNLHVDAHGNRNFQVLKHLTGHSVFEFTTSLPDAQVGEQRLVWRAGEHEESVEILPGYELLHIGTDLPLGALVDEDSTTFRFFAPRAHRVTVCVYQEPDGAKKQNLQLSRVAKGVWEASYPRNLHGWYYHYSVHSPADDDYSHFDDAFKILDPYAVASLGATGPGIIWDREKLPRPQVRYNPPAVEDLVVVEAHVRDLAKNAPVNLTDQERLGFTGLRKWVEAEGNYLRTLGVNAVELQPVQEFGDVYDKAPYHWGYMPVNFFAPESTYGSNPAAGAQMEEFAQLVDAFHRQGLAVILDVVYNHVGEPNHLIHIDKYYYFDLNSEGMLMNWSGCGNTLRCDTRMGKRLLVDSLVHLVKIYGVDGFRFDLGELVGVEALSHVEEELRKVKKDVILIAEPWSFRGDIKGPLRETSYSFWNDEYREFLPRYVHGTENRDGLSFFLRGCPGRLTDRPSQTVNYVESHDDFTWIDRITEVPNHKGNAPTRNDRRRTHMMVGVLMCSLGVPMISAGQDMLRSKNGNHNTYRHGDLNALDYRRALQFPASHDYFGSWIRFRLGNDGAALRLREHPGEGYFKELHSESDHSSLGLVYNADDSRKCRKLLFAVNPHLDTVQLDTGGIDLRRWRQLADHERFDAAGLSGAIFPHNDGKLELPPLSCCLFAERG